MRIRTGRHAPWRTARGRPLTDSALDSAGLTDSERSFGRLLRDCFDLRLIPIHRTCGLRAIAIDQFRAGFVQLQNRVPCGFPTLRRISILRRHARTDVANATESLVKPFRLHRGDGDDIAGNGVRNATIVRISSFLRPDRPRNVERFVRACRSLDIVRLRNVWSAVIAGPGNDIASSCSIVCDGRAIDPAASAQRHQSELIECRHIMADSQQESRFFGTIRFTAAIGASGCDAEPSIRKTEQKRVFQ